MILKHGKRELREDTPAQARKKMKRTLLYTYFTSLACLVLCCAMFLGTTMAWFSDDVTNSGNVIQVGTLAAKIYRVEDSAHLDLSDSQNPAFVFNEAWKPTDVNCETFKIVNGGDLAFSYELDILLKPDSAYKTVAVTNEEANVTGDQRVMLNDEEIQKLLSCFEVYVIEGKADAASLQQYLGVNITAESPLGTVETEDTTPVWQQLTDQSGQHVTLAQVVAEPVENATDKTKAEDILVWSGIIEPSEQESVEVRDIFTVGIRMKSNVDASVMGWNMELVVQLTANQLTNTTTTTVDTTPTT